MEMADAVLDEIGRVQSGNVKDYNPSFQKVYYSFFAKYVNAKTDEDFKDMAKDLRQFITPLEVDMAVAVLNEIERLQSA